ncbi:MAG: twin-arginine translocase subunit TatC [Thermoanaerobaculia bacterium]|nr:twin-arginine translocase subunit TatC [Thermoanaerobaculia bacterium]
MTSTDPAEEVSRDETVERPPEEPLGAMSLLDHLDELRRRLVVSIVSVIVGFVVCWNWAPEIWQLIQYPIVSQLPPGERLAYTHIAAPFFLYMKVAAFAGLFASAPLIVLQVWLFISPGLYPRERRWAAPFIFFSSLFFLAGGYFGYRVILPLACGFFIQMGEDFQNVLTIDSYFAFAFKLVVGMAVVFETPILIFFLSKLGIVTPRFLMRNFKYAVVIIFILAAIITPTPDPVTQSTLAVPMILLYLLGVLISWMFGTKRK